MGVPRRRLYHARRDDACATVAHLQPIVDRQRVTFVAQQPHRSSATSTGTARSLMYGAVATLLASSAVVVPLAWPRRTSRSSWGTAPRDGAVAGTCSVRRWAAPGRRR